MAVPKLPVFYNMPYTLNDGTLTAEAHLYNDQLWQSLNLVVNQAIDGYQIPQKTAAQITDYRDDLSVPIGTTWFNTGTAQLNVKTVQAVYDTSEPPVLITPGTIRIVQFV